MYLTRFLSLYFFAQKHVNWAPYKQAKMVSHEIIEKFDLATGVCVVIVSVSERSTFYMDTYWMRSHECPEFLRKEKGQQISYMN